LVYLAYLACPVVSRLAGLLPGGVVDDGNFSR